MTTMERLAKVEQKVDDLKEATETGFSDIKNLLVDLEKRIDTALEKKAGKWVETIIKILIGSIATGGVTVIVALITGHLRF